MASSRKRSQNELAIRVRDTIVQHVPPGARLTLALSGGIDSVTALDLLARLAPAHPFALSCVHINHRISSNAGRWARFARLLARRYGVTCLVRTVDIARYRGMGLEGAARAARYAAFARIRADFIVLAQHQDDQAETVLLQLTRGAGAMGLAGMPMVNTTKGPRLLRPLLNVSRAEIEAYARAHALRWVEDETNADENLWRNRIRRRVIPELRAMNPAAAANLARSAAHLAEANELAEALAEIDAKAAMDDGHVQVGALTRLSRSRAKNVLRWMLSRASEEIPSTAQLDEMLEQLLFARADASVRIPLAGLDVRRYQGAIWLVPRRPVVAGFRAEWDGSRPWNLAELGGKLRFKRVRGRGLAAAAFERQLVEVRTRSGGERFQPERNRPRRALKALLQEAGIPPWERACIPLVYCGGRLAFVPGIGIAAGLHARPDEAGVELQWHHRNGC
jgi:tRNA(Ile)-lysidine synthase